VIRQPTLGFLGTAIVVAISLGFVSLFSFSAFSGWVSYYIVALIPTQVVIAVTWGCKHPGFAGSRNQPAKGTLLLLFTMVLGAIAAAVLFVTVGGGINPPTPMLVICNIVAVPIAFWGALIWGGWPFTALSKNPVVVGVAILIACYLVNYAVFWVFFDYGFMKDAPIYAASLDPHGFFNAWKALTFCITGAASMFLLVNFDLWPLTKSKSIMRQPWLGIAWTIAVLVLASVVFNVGVTWLGADPVAFLVSVPIPFVFGTIILQNSLQGSLYRKMTQPFKGVLNAATAAVIGNALAWLYRVLAPIVTGRLSSGPPAYDFEIWLASALLAVTFPFLIFQAEFFELWPLKRAEKVQSVTKSVAAGG
jgi:hypothetical protein